MALNTWGGLNIWGEESGIDVSVTEVIGPVEEQSLLLAVNPLDINISVGEIIGPIDENSNIEIPIKITINPSNLIRVKRKNNTVRVT